MRSRIYVALLLLSSFVFSAQQDPTSSGTAIIWRDPGPIETLDLFWGNGSEARAPKPPFKFLEESLKGTVAKVVVEDARGDVWDVKLAGEESHPEVVATRLLWALGYPVHEMYFVHEGTIQGAKGLKRAEQFIKDDGRFAAARFRRRDASMTEAGKWAFDTTPFTGRQELSGLIILMALINNWDTADVQNKDIVDVKTAGGTERWYLVQDLGASFGHFKGPQGTPIKWSLKDFQRDGLVARVNSDSLILNYPAFGTPPTTVPIEHARWFASLVGRLTDVQIRAAFEAGGATEAEVEGFAQKLAAKIAELKAATGTTTQQ